MDFSIEVCWGPDFREELYELNIWGWPKHARSMFSWLCHRLEKLQKVRVEEFAETGGYW